MPALKCQNCGWEGTPVRPYCEECGQRMVAPLPPPPPPGEDHSPLELASPEKKKLEERIDALERELERAHRKPAMESGGVADTSFQEKARLAEERAASLEGELVSKSSQLHEVTSKLAALSSPGTAAGIKTIGISKSLSLALVGAAMVVGLVFGHYIPRNSQAQTQSKQLNSQLKDDEDKLRTLYPQLDAANNKAGQLSKDLESRDQQVKEASGKVEKLQRQLNSMQIELAQKVTAERQARLQLQAEGQRVLQLSQENAAKGSQVAALQQMLDKHPSWNYKGPMQGYVQWEGDLRKDKPTKDKLTVVTTFVTIDHGQASADQGTKSTLLSGDFPGVPCRVQPMDRNVFIQSPPSEKDGWRKVVIKVEGKGHLSARLKWEVF